MISRDSAPLRKDAIINYNKRPAFHECCVLLIFTLILAKDETAAAGFKASESLCLPQLDR